MSKSSTEIFNTKPAESKSEHSHCRLPTVEKQTRFALIKDILSKAVLTKQLTEGRSWTFDYSATLKHELEDLVENEKQCCGNLEWKLEHDHEAKHIYLSVLGLDPQSTVFKRLEESIPASSSESKLARAAKAGGIGVAGSLILCCTLPIGIAAFAGAAIAAPFATLLENPLIILAGAFLMAIPAWFFVKRKRVANGKCGC